MQQLVNTALGGITLGMVYAAFALALVLIWRSTRIVNFAQAPMAMVTTFVALEHHRRRPLLLAGVRRRAARRPAARRGRSSGVVIRPVEGRPRSTR